MDDEGKDGTSGPGTPPAESTAAPVPAEPAEDWETRFKYLYADFENYRRRAERDRESLNRQTRGALLRELLPILEAFEAARAATERLPAGDPLRRGFDLLAKEWGAFLKHEGVQPVSRVGAEFRAEEAEAVGESSPRADAPVGTVTEVVQQGYRYFGGLLRPAKVVVARAPPADSSDAGAAAAESEGKP